MLSTRDPPQNKGHKQTESEGLEKDIARKQRPKESRSSNIHIRQNRLLKKGMKRDKEGHYIMIKGSIQEEDMTIINIYAPNIGAPQYVRQMLTSMKVAQIMNSFWPNSDLNSRKQGKPLDHSGMT